MWSPDIPRTTYTVLILLFATAIGYALVSSEVQSYSRNNVRTKCRDQTIIQPKPIFYHVHIAKTAGSSFNRVVARRYYGVCGHKGYSFAQNYLDEIRPRDDRVYSGYGLDRVHPARMRLWGFHNCAFISHETDWRDLGNIANDTVWYMDGHNIIVMM